MGSPVMQGITSSSVENRQTKALGFAASTLIFGPSFFSSFFSSFLSFFPPNTFHNPLIPDDFFFLLACALSSSSDFLSPLMTTCFLYESSIVGSYSSTYHNRQKNRLNFVNLVEKGNKIKKNYL